MKKLLSFILSLCLVLSIVPMGLFSITASAAVSEDGFEYKISNYEATITGYLGDETSLVIPSYLGGYPVTGIDSDAFFGYEKLTNISVDENNKNFSSLDGVLFNKDKTLLIQYPAANKRTEYSIPNSVTSIGYGAFYWSSLTSITIPTSVTKISAYAFYSYQLTNVYYYGTPEEKERINIDSNNYDLESANWYYNSCINTRQHTYTDNFDTKCNVCGNIRSIDSEKVTIDYITYEITPSENGAYITVTKCDRYVRGDITFLDKVYNYPVIRVGAWAFEYCTSLTSITIPNSVTRIDYQAFVHCNSLTSITIPNSVTSINEQAFASCESLTDVYYCGTPEEKEEINIGSNNYYLEFANWHYNICKNQKHSYSGLCDDSCNKCEWTRKTNVNHIYEWIIDKQENCGVDGKKHETCTLCHITRNEDTVIPATGNHSYKNDLDYSCDVCGFLKAGITKQPTDVLVTSGSKATVTIGAVGDGLTYEWYYRNQGYYYFYLDTSFTGNTYSVDANSTSNGRQIYCIVTDKYGNSVKSNTATISTKNVAKISTQPVSVTVANGKKATVTVKAVGDGLTYKWYYKEKGSSAFLLTNSFKGNTYSVDMNAARNGRQIYCIVTDKYGKSVKSNTVTISMKTVAKISAQPVSVTVANGKKATVTVKAVGDGLTYKWYYKEKSRSYFSLTKSFTGNTYSVDMNAERNGRQIYCIVTDKYGNSVKSNTVTISMRTLAKISAQPVSVTVANGKKATVTVKAVGDGLTYKWYYKEKGAKSFTLTNSFKGNTYSVDMNAARSGRQLYCVITDKYGNSVKSNTVTISMKTVVKIKYSPANASVKKNANAKFTVTAVGDGLKYQWQVKTSSTAAWKNTTITGYNTKTITVAATAARKGYKYRCIITDKYGNKVISGTATLYIN